MFFTLKVTQASCDNALKPCQLQLFRDLQDILAVETTKKASKELHYLGNFVCS